MISVVVGQNQGQSLGPGPELLQSSNSAIMVADVWLVAQANGDTAHTGTLLEHKVFQHFWFIPVTEWTSLQIPQGHPFPSHQGGNSHKCPYPTLQH